MLHLTGSLNRYLAQLPFWRLTALCIGAFIGLSLAIGYCGFIFTDLNAHLLPREDSTYPWDINASSDTARGGLSQVYLGDTASSIAFWFRLKDAAEFPYAGINLMFANGADRGRGVDLSKYSHVTLDISCSPSNTLVFHVSSFDPEVSTVGDFSSYRKASMPFDCYEEVQSKQVDLKRLVVPQWWLEEQGLKLSDTEFRIDEILGLQLTSSLQSPLDVTSNVDLTGVTLQGHNWRVLQLVAVCWLVFGAGVVVWWLKVVRASSAAKTANNGRQHSDRRVASDDDDFAVSQYDQETELVLCFFANEYTKLEMSLDYAVGCLGINRNKINAILKKHVSLTSSDYIKKLRLDEAARLLKGDEHHRISAVAQALGYQNVSYFNRIFKLQYGCSPKNYRRTHRNGDAL